MLSFNIWISGQLMLWWIQSYSTCFRTFKFHHWIFSVKIRFPPLLNTYDQPAGILIVLIFSNFLSIFLTRFGWELTEICQKERIPNSGLVTSLSFCAWHKQLHTWKNLPERNIFALFAGIFSDFLGIVWDYLKRSYPHMLCLVLFWLCGSPA